MRYWYIPRRRNWDHSRLGNRASGSPRRSPTRPPREIRGRGRTVRPRYVGVDNAGGVDWIAVADGEVDADAVLRDPGLLRWVPQAAVDQVEVAPLKRLGEAKSGFLVV